MEECEDNLSAEEIQNGDNSPAVKVKPKKRSLVERELETNLTSRVTSPVTGEGASTSRYGRARRSTRGTDIDAEKMKPLKIDTKPQPQAYKMHASNSPIRKDSPKRPISVASSIEDQIENIYNENMSLSRFGSEEISKGQSPAKKFPKIYIRKDLTQKPDMDDIVLIKNLFSPTNKSNTYLNNILERSSEKCNLNGHTTSRNGFPDTASVVKTLDFDGKKKKNELKERVVSKNELFELEAGSEYQVGDLAWARVGTYPFWPCIVTREPYSDMFVKKKLFGRVEHDILHVTFFGDNGRRGWIVDNMLRKYSGRAEFESTREKFTPEAKKKDPRLYAAHFVSEKKLPLWNVSVEEAETFLREPKRLRIDLLHDLLEKSRGTKSTPKRDKGGKISRTDSDVSLSESLYDTLFSEDDGKNDDNSRSKKARNKSLDVSEVVTACLDNMAAKSGITKIQKQSHMDRWLQKAKSKTPEKSQPKLRIKNDIERKRDRIRKPKESRKSKSRKNECLNSEKNLLPYQNEHDYSSVNYENHDGSNINIGFDNSGYVNTLNGSGIGVVAKVERLTSTEECQEDIITTVVNDDIVITDAENISKDIKVVDANDNDEIITKQEETVVISVDNSIRSNETEQKQNKDEPSKQSKDEPKIEVPKTDGTQIRRSKRKRQSLEDRNNSIVQNKAKNAKLDLGQSSDVLKTVTNGLEKHEKEVDGLIGNLKCSEVSDMGTTSTLKKTDEWYKNNIISMNGAKPVVVIEPLKIMGKTRNKEITQMPRDVKNDDSLSKNNDKEEIDEMAVIEKKPVQDIEIEVSKEIILVHEKKLNHNDTNTVANGDSVLVNNKHTENEIINDKVAQNDVVCNGISDSAPKENKLTDEMDVDGDEILNSKDRIDESIHSETSADLINTELQVGTQDTVENNDTEVNNSPKLESENKENTEDMKEKDAKEGTSVVIGKEMYVFDRTLSQDYDEFYDNANDENDIPRVAPEGNSEKKYSSSKNKDTVLNNEVALSQDYDEIIEHTNVYKNSNIVDNIKTDSNDLSDKVSNDVLTDKIVEETRSIDFTEHLVEIDGHTETGKVKEGILDIKDNCKLTNDNLTKDLLNKQSKPCDSENEKSENSDDVEEKNENFDDLPLIECIEKELKSRLRLKRPMRISTIANPKPQSKPDETKRGHKSYNNAMGSAVCDELNKDTADYKNGVKNSDTEDSNVVVKTDEQYPIDDVTDAKVSKEDPKRNGFIESKESSPERRLEDYIDPETASVKSEDSRVPITRRKQSREKSGKKAKDDSEFLECLEFRKEDLNHLKSKPLEPENEKSGKPDDVEDKNEDLLPIERLEKEVKSQRLSLNRAKRNSTKSNLKLQAKSDKTKREDASDNNTTESAVCDELNKDSADSKNGVMNSDTEDSNVVVKTVDENPIDDVTEARVSKGDLKINGFIESKESSPERKLKDDIDPETASIKSEDSGVSITRRKQRREKNVKKAMDDPEFLKYLEFRQDALIDEQPELNQDEIVTYLYQTWLYEESNKSDIKKTEEAEQSNLVKGLNTDHAPQPKKIKKKPKVEKEPKLEKEKEPNVDIKDLALKDKPKRKITQTKPYYNEDFSDLEEEDLETFSIFDKDVAQNEDGEPIDEVELYFEKLTKPKPNVFKGYIRERVCEICERTENLVKCKACHGMFHVECVEKEVEIVEVPAPTRGRKKKKKPGRGRKPKGYEDSIPDSESQSDEKSQDANNSEDMNLSLEDEIESHITFDADYFETQWELKMKEVVPDTVEDFVSDQEIIWDAPPGQCEIVEMKHKEKPVDYSNFKCKDCQKHETPVCFVCKSHKSPKGEEVRQKCQVAHCHRHYHLECLEYWPQTQFNSWEPSKNNKNKIEYIEALSCPRHVCHTCVSDDPRGCRTRFCGDKLARCVRCPATYHSFTKCLPAGTQILTASQIICPRHYEHRPGKVPCHVNTGWCFICALGGTLICCEYCPTSFHAECLNIKPPEGSYMCEDCETGRLPLYGEMVWVKLGHYRWWPGIILHPTEIPDNIMAVKHSQGEFVVRFFGQYDHYWVNRGRVFPFQEGDSGKISSQKSKIDAAFTTAMEHAQRACEILKNIEPNEEEDMDIASSLLPPHYVKLKVNKPVGSLVARRDVDSNSLTQCDCDVTLPEPCGLYTHCLNRMLLTECGPLCRAGERCNNRAFEKRLYPRLAAARTASRGWGLKALEDIKQGQFVIEYVGELIDEEEFRRRMCRKHEVRDENYYFLTLDKERMIDAGPKGNLARFMNHCCEPNCETQKWTVLGDVRVGLFALRDIPANSELTFNYNLECAGIEKKRCLCGAKRCSGYIGAKPKQEEAQPKKLKGPGKRTYKKRKNVEDSPSTSKIKPPVKIKIKPLKPRELTEIEKDLLIIKNATNGMSSDSEGSRLSSVDEKKDAKPLKRKRVSFSTDEFSSKKTRLEDKGD